ncbi:dynein regulatory complex protein 9-like [Antedon mediterranea]|uniref:dynein regulatory complex protein 9-like n=1 Tax=Antedon mediterranea TaxID=105859 RepID=UPI003AF4EC0C
MATLPQLDAIHLATVLDDTIDQLAVLGKIMPQTLENRPDANDIVGDEIGDILESQRNLETRYEQLILKRAELREGGRKEQLKVQENNQEIGDVIGGLRLKTNHFSKALKQNPLTPDNLAKVQKDRQYVQDILSATLQEMREQQQFTSLVKAVTLEQDNKTQLQNTILKEEEGRKRIKMLQRQIMNIKTEREEEIQQRDEMIAHLKDQLQEMKAKTNMEGKYVQKDAEVTVQQTQKHCFLTDKQLKEEIDRYKKMIDEEVRVNQEIEQYLKTHQLELDQRVEFWMEKYDKDVEAKTHELDVLKASKANDLARLQELTKLYGNYEHVVVEDRIEKEKERRKREQEEEELKSIISVQSWWRGVMVRKQLGPYSKKKKKKGGKKGKKGSGKKKGKKKK